MKKLSVFFVFFFALLPQISFGQRLELNPLTPRLYDFDDHPLLDRSPVLPEKSMIDPGMVIIPKNWDCDPGILLPAINDDIDPGIIVNPWNRQDHTPHERIRMPQASPFQSPYRPFNSLNPLTEPGLHFNLSQPDLMDIPHPQFYLDKGFHREFPYLHRGIE